MFFTYTHSPLYAITYISTNSNNCLLVPDTTININVDSITSIYKWKGTWLTPEVIIESDKQEYNPIGNPAIELLYKIQEEHRNNIKKLSTDEVKYSGKRFENLTLCLANFNMNNKFLNKLIPFFYKYVEESVFDKSHILPLSIRESVTSIGVDKNKNTKNEIVLYRNRLGIDQNIDDGTMTQSLDEMFPEINIYNPTIKLLNNRFSSPLADNATNYYKYYLTDTIVNSNGDSIAILSFYPFIPEAFTFRGSLFVNIDKNYSIERCEFEVPEYINLNFVDKLRIEIEFKRLNNGLLVPKTENMYTSFSLYKKLLKLYSIHNRVYDDYNFKTPDSLVINSPSKYLDLSSTDSIYNKGKYAKEKYLLSTNEGLKMFLDDLHKIPFYNWAFNTVDMISTGYIRTNFNKDLLYGGSKLDIGPVSNFISKNYVEGHRVRVGARSTGYFSSIWFFEGFLAYGFRDKKWKYSGTVSWSNYKKKYFLNEFPKKDISLTKEFDLYTPGQIYSYYGKDNMLYSLGSAYLTNRSYRDLLRLTYRQDWMNGLSLRAEITKSKDTPTGTYSYLKILPDSTLKLIPSINETKIGIFLRFAPGRKFYQGSSKDPDRIKISKDIPILDFSHEISFPFWGGEFYYHKSELAFEHNWWIKNYGNLDYKLLIGKIWNRVPFPMLYTPRANSSLEIHRNAFQMMEPMEYIADEYVNLFINYHMRGLILNKIPLIKKLKMREVFIFNGMFGNISNVNSFENGHELFIIPPYVTPMKMTWYGEIGIGFENILKILRFDVYRRLSPSNLPDMKKWGIKLKFHLDF